MNCKPGILAYIARDPFPENVGRVVRVIAPASPIYGCAAWTVQGEGAPFHVLDVSTGARGLSNDGDCLDADLRPISGVPVEAEEGAEVLV